MHEHEHEHEHEPVSVLVTRLCSKNDDSDVFVRPVSLILWPLIPAFFFSQQRRRMGMTGRACVRSVLSLCRELFVPEHWHQSNQKTRKKKGETMRTRSFHHCVRE